MKKELPRISIILPVYNAEKTLERALLSVLNQGYQNLELIVIDGGSKDNTIEVIKRYEKDIFYWHSQPDGSPNVAFNYGIEKATGDIIAFLFADDGYEAGVLNKVADCFFSQPDLELVTCQGRVVIQNAQGAYETLQNYEESVLALTLKNLCFGSPAIGCRFFKRALFGQANRFKTFDDQGKHIYSADREFLLRLALKRINDKYLDFLGYSYLSHPGSSTFSGQISTIKRIYQEHREIAQTFLNLQNLSAQDRKILSAWRNDQIARLLLREMLTRDFDKAFKVLKIGFREGGIEWCRQLLKLPWEWIRQRVLSSRILFWRLYWPRIGLNPFRH